VRVKVEACGICHSDSLVKEGLWPGIQYPRVPGHEVIGVVDGVGEGVKPWKSGQRVGVGWHGGNCGYCDHCRRGEFFACTVNLLTTGISFDGGYGEYMVAPAEALALVPDELNAVDSAPLMCAGVTTFNALRNSGATAGDVVAVLGIGGLGYLGVQFAARMGFNTVAIAREVKARLARAKALAPDHPAVLEAEGDLAMAQRRYVQAQQLYKAAFDADRSNARLEEKFATALVKVHTPEYASRHIPDDVDSIWSFHVRRPAWASGLLSALCPGLGQFYNGDWLKGLILLFIQIGIASTVIHNAWIIADAMARQFGVMNAQGHYVLTADHYGEFTFRLLHSFSTAMLLLLTALWVYSVVDAIMAARAIAEESNA
jgi:hypothetical protein